MKQRLPKTKANPLRVKFNQIFSTTFWKTP